MHTRKFAGVRIIAGCTRLLDCMYAGKAFFCKTKSSSQSYLQRNTVLTRDVEKNELESQNVRGWKGPLWVTQSNPPAEAGSPRAGCTAPRPGRAGISPEKQTPQPPWAAWARAPSPSEWSSSSSSAGTCCASFCARCPLSCRWAPLKSLAPFSWE